MPSHGRIQDIERLRALAALGVVLGHVPWLQAASERLLRFHLDPWTGVDLFFVISGFVVSRAFERDLGEAGGPSPLRAAVAAFYRKRTARIVPTAWLVVALWVAGLQWFNRAGAWGTVTGGLWPATAASLAFVANYAEAGWGVALPIIGYWSLCIEEHFYAAYAAFRALVASSAARLWLLVAVIVAVQAWGAVTGATRTSPGLSHVRMDQLAMGVVLGLLRERWTGARRWDAALRVRGWRRAAARLGLVALIALLASLAVTWLDVSRGDAPMFVWGRVLATLVPGAIVWVAASDADLLAVRTLRLGDALAGIGARSYALYLMHMPAFIIVTECRARWFGATMPVWMPIAEVLAFAVLLAGMVEANYRIVERPLIAWAAKPR